jgi:predicted  nucleic acid-binding Zn-ribbon protein
MEKTIAQKLEELLKLQSIDTELDRIKKIRGDLPEEVRDLEDEIAGYGARIQKFEREVKDLNEQIAQSKQNIKDAEKLINKYQDQQMKVRNNREYDAISKEIESQQLDIKLMEKAIKEAQYKIGKKEEDIDALKAVIADRKQDLKAKKAELDDILSESKDEENKLKSEREKAVKNIEERLLSAYNRIRSNVRNGLAVVSVKRGACGGCFNMVPPQRQVEIREKKKLIVCEHCGRILADVDLEPETVATPSKRQF